MSALITLEQAAYLPATLLRGRVKLDPLPEDEKRRVELSVLWETEGKGDTDQGVIHHRVLADGDYDAAHAAHAFEVTLPALPVSYDGVLVKVCWRVRVRRLGAAGIDGVYDHTFPVAWPK